ncbi:MAG TPA: SAM-dependent methyltransferase [Woeseiaceae bacterium]|nr:SAM-dependent methyltransferase [Woeseiaceae bacterium]
MPLQVKSHLPSGLPVPDPDSRAHSDLVAAYIRARIAESGGSIGFAEFMQHALYAPGLGYYSAGSRKFGVGGDFVTAPEISPLFGRVLGAQCAELLGELPQASVLELGAGSGALAVDLLAKLASLNALPRQYMILEPSAELQARQKERLAGEVPEILKRVEWLSSLPRDFVGVVIANEVADALPVSRFVIRKGNVAELRVVARGNGFGWLEQEAEAPLRTAVGCIEQDMGARLPDGFVSEVCLAMPGWIGDLAVSVGRGFVFLFDYGMSRREYYSAGHDGGWLRCHFRHRVHDDPLILPGIQDLTAWVDFSMIADAATRNGMEVTGYLTQAHFLLGGGLQRELEQLSALPVREQFETSRQVKLLTLPGEMGEHFKCIGLRKGAVTVPSVFELSDRAHTL